MAKINFSGIVVAVVVTAVVLLVFGVAFCREGLGERGAEAFLVIVYYMYTV